MNKHTVQEQMQELITEAGYEPRSYSGRFMYGKQCLAVDLDRGQLGAFIADIILSLHNHTEETHSFDAAEKAFREMQTDSMGLGQVLYFPNVPYTDVDYSADSAKEE